MSYDSCLSVCRRRFVRLLKLIDMKPTSPHRWPAEWEPQAATWLSWPHNLDTWPGQFETIPGVYLRWIEELAKIQPVHLLTGPEHVQAVAARALEGISNVSLHPWPTNDVWIRDMVPPCQTQRDGQLVGIDWRYNAWGGKYPPYADDARVAEAICRGIGCQRSCSAMYCEGGGLDTDGLGTLLTTSSCLLSPSRNPGWTRAMVEEELKRQLGVTHIIWVDGGGLRVTTPTATSTN